MNAISLQENKSPSITPSPISRSLSGSSAAGSAPNCRMPPSPTIPITRCDDPNNPCPITFVQTDASSFKHVVQMLTGSAETSASSEIGRNPIPSLKTGPRKDHKSANSKLYERRHSFKNFKISPLASGPVHARPGVSFGLAGSPEILSPSILDFPLLALSPVKPLTGDPFNRVGSTGSLALAAEDKAIKEKGFFLHPSPANTPRETEPRLLQLFPVTLPKVTGSFSSGANA